MSKDTAFVAEKQITVDITEEANEVCPMSKTETLEATMKSDSWVIDSGSPHKLPSSALPSPTTKESMGTGAQTAVAGVGDIVINASVDGSAPTVKLENALHIPSFGQQLHYVAQMDRWIS